MEQPTDPSTAIPDSEELVPSRAAHLTKTSVEEESPSQDLQEIYHHLEQNNIQGWIIDMNDEPPEAGIQDAQKLQIEHIPKYLEHPCIWNTGKKGKSYESDGYITEEESELQDSLRSEKNGDQSLERRRSCLRRSGS